MILVEMRSATRFPLNSDVKYPDDQREESATWSTERSEGEVEFQFLNISNCRRHYIFVEPRAPYPIMY